MNPKYVSVFVQILDAFKEIGYSGTPEFRRGS